MKNTAKITGLFTLLFLLTSGMVVSMDRAEEYKELPEYFIKVKQNICNFPSMKIQGIIELLSGCPVSFCSKEDIEYLNRIGIQADENTPVVAINSIFVKNPKVDPGEEDTYSDWVEGAPKLVFQHALNHIDAAIRKEDATIEECWKKNTKESIGEASGREIAMKYGEQEAKNNIKNCTFPSILPVMLFLQRSGTIHFSKIFGFCDVALTCGREDLFAKIDAFNQSPSMVIPFDVLTIKKMRRLEADGEDLKAQRLCISVMTKARDKIEATEEMLIASGIISFSTRDDQPNFVGFGNTCAHCDLNRAPGQNFPDIRKMTLEDNFPKKNIFKALQGRELGYK